MIRCTAMPPLRPSARPGFTLVELLVVMAIMGIIAAMAIPAISSVLRSYNLKNTAQVLIAQLNFARQTAVAGSQAVEVRFYQLPDSDSTSGNTLRGVQAFAVGAPTTGTTPTYTPLGKAMLFPGGIVISSNAIDSTLFTSTFVNPGISNSIATLATDTTNPLPPPYGAAPYYSFRFHGTGQTDLLPATTSSNGKPVSPILTLYSESAPKLASNGLPANFITIEIDVINGTIRSYQP